MTDLCDTPLYREGDHLVTCGKAKGHAGFCFPARPVRQEPPPVEPLRVPQPLTDDEVWGEP